ncbi:acyltransferase family protein [Kitasatospora sp. NPDC059571]|uniref:acyltransferase family protein n=1 Tax=Kitasatospora sp. NPDC059571 TaxID=3346871 RepID=UPI003696FF29
MTRDRYPDLLRAAAIALVVTGHWLITALTHQGGALAAPELLATVPWTQWLTLAFQIMPVFFLAGGRAAGGSLARHRAAGGRSAGWIRQRAVRLLLPTAAYAALALGGLTAARAAGADPALLGTVGWALAMQFWFLPVYLLITALTPMLAAAHRRWGLAVPAVLTAAAAAVGLTPLHDLAYLLVWAVPYQLGLCWQDGLLDGRRRLLAGIAGAGAAAFALLVGYGPYPISLILVTGEAVSNTDPPSAALLAWAVAQCALCVLAGPAARGGRAGGGGAPRPPPPPPPGPGSMTLYLWHMVPVLAAAALLYLPRLAPEPSVGSAAWWALRPVWLAVLALLLAGLLVLLRPLERGLGRLAGRLRPAAGSAGPAGPARLLLGLALAVPALAVWARTGFAHSGAPSGPTVLAFAAGTVLVLAPPRPEAVVTVPPAAAGTRPADRV